MSRLKSILLIFFLLFFCSICVFAEDLTITTYYPSPYGSYNALQANRLGVGDNNGDSALTFADVPTNPGEVWIAGNVGIGTIAPQEFLQVSEGSLNTERRALRVGSSYVLNIQNYINNGADSAIFQNAYIDGGSGLSETYRWTTTHASFGSRGIRFGYGAANGITFYADSVATTANSSFTPTARMYIENSGDVGIGNTAPGAKLDVTGTVRVNGANQVYRCTQPATNGILTTVSATCGGTFVATSLYVD